MDSPNSPHLLDASTTSADVTTSSSNHPCRLLDLPGELRLEIYEYVFYPLFTAETVCEDNPQISNETVNIFLTSREILKDAADSYQKILRARINFLEWAVRVLGSPHSRLPGIVVTTKESRKRGRLFRKGCRNRLHRSKTILGKWKASKDCLRWAMSLARKFKN